MRRLHTLTDRSIATYAVSARSYVVSLIMRSLAGDEENAPPYYRPVIITDAPTHASYVSDGMGRWIAHWDSADSTATIRDTVNTLIRDHPDILSVLYLVHVEDRAMADVAEMMGRSLRRCYQMREEGEKWLLDNVAPSALYALVQETSILDLAYCATLAPKDTPSDG